MTRRQRRADMLARGRTEYGTHAPPTREATPAAQRASTRDWHQPSLTQKCNIGWRVKSGDGHLIRSVTQAISLVDNNTRASCTQPLSQPTLLTRSRRCVKPPPPRCHLRTVPQERRSMQKSGCVSITLQAPVVLKYQQRSRLRTTIMYIPAGSTVTHLVSRVSVMPEHFLGFLKL
jgi:hypothetical protein